MENNEAREQFKKGLTKEQIKFLDVMDNNALVSASAGSGKTFTLIKKLVDLIVYYHISVNNLLVVTFTNSAGEELRSKLYSELLKEINTTTNKDINKENLFKELEKIKMADIGTLHAVCYKYVLQYFYKCGINPASTILSDSDTKVMLDQAIDEVIDEYLNLDDEEFYNLYDSFSKSRNSGEIKKIIKSLYYFIQSIPNQEEWLNNSNNSKENNSLDTNVFANYIFNQTKNMFDEFERIFFDLKRESEELGLEKHSVALSQMLSDIFRYKDCNNFVEANQMVYNQFKFLDTRYLWKKESTLRCEFNEKFSSIKKAFNKHLAKIKDYYINIDTDELIATNQKANIQVQKLFEIVQKVSTCFNQFKTDKAGLDYNDLEHKMLELLGDNEVKKELQNSFSYIFVDEYQDINPVQEEILVKLSHKNNMYMIGDVKQSIYGFRMSTPDIFIEKYNSFQQNIQNGEPIDLNENYRSLDNILQFVNMIFSVIGLKETMGVDYKNKANLTCGMKKATNNNEHCVELNIINAKNDQETSEENGEIENTDSGENDDENEMSDSKTELKEKQEAMLVLNKVKYYLTQKYYDFKSGKLVSVEYKDIAILIRDKSRVLEKIYTNLLLSNIPVSTEIKISLFEKYEVAILTNLLKLVNNSQDELALASVLLSPIGKMTNEELAIIKNKYQKDFYACVVEYKDNMQDEIGKKLNAVFDLLFELNQMQNTKTLGEMISAVLEEYDLYSFFESFTDGAEKKNNIEQFLSILGNENYKNNLVLFIDYLKIMEADSQTYMLQNGANSVSIMTMHKSKGLDFPVVIAVELGKSFSEESFKGDLLLTKDLGVGLCYNESDERRKHITLSYQANKLSKWVSERKEQLRLFYVALTRPKNYLCLIGTYDINAIEKLTYKNILDCNSFMELILYSILKNKGNNISTKNKNEIAINDDLFFDMNYIIPNEIEMVENENKIEIHKNIPSVDLVSALKNQFQFVYQNDAKRVAIKNTVTSLLQEGDYENYCDEPQDLMLQEKVALKNQEALDLGVAYHAVLERVDYGTENNVEDIINKLVEMRRINSDIVPKINIKKIQKTVQDVKGLITPTTKYIKEKQFMIKDSYQKLVGGNIDTKVLVQGVIDLILMDKDEAILIDFKTNKTTNEFELKEKYKLQLDLYAYAVEAGLNVKVKNKYLYSIFLNKFINLA